MSEPTAPAADNGLILPNNIYNILKPVVQIFMPGLATLYSTLAALYEWDNSAIIVGTIVAVNTFMGLFLGLTSRNYNNSDAKYDGSIDVINTDDGNQVVQLNLPEDPQDLIVGKDVLLKVN